MAAAVVLAWPVSPSATAQLPLPLPGTGGPQPGAYQENDFGGFRNVLPPGENGLANAADIALFETTKAKPAHNDDQLGMYRDLVYAIPGLTSGDVPNYFKDASFGVPAGQVGRTYSPRSDVTIARDKQFGVPHIYGSTRAGVMFGAGYAAAEDRLFFMDVLRHLGRAQLSSFAGGAPGNREFDRQQWAAAPYTEADLTKQVNQFTTLYGAAGAQLADDAANYIAGINQYISEARLDPLKMPGEYAAIGRAQGPDDWKGEDIVATAALVGAIFGNGGGQELGSVKVLDQAVSRFGRPRGRRVWADFRSAEDPEAPTTVHRRKFAYERVPRRVARHSVALPDHRSLKLEQGETISHSSSSSSAAQPTRITGLRGLLAFPHGNSNALLVAARHSQSGRPLAVFGPQTAYFAPEILMEEDMHGPGIQARGAAFPGTNLYVQLGRGEDYAWSATSAGQDIADTWALRLCEPGGGRPTINSMHYLWRGACRSIEVLTRTNSWTPNLADQTPPGSETLRVERTPLGIVTGRARIHRRPVIYVTDRTTYFHEVDSGIGFADMNDPDKIHSAHDFQVAMSKVGYAFNWFYADNANIAYFNSGNNPVRARGINPNFPVWGRKRFEWRRFNPANNTAAYTPFSRHPRVVNQDYLTSWNNKQARGFRAADGQWGYGPLYRSQPLDARIKQGIARGGKMSLAGLISAMEDAATVDLRGDRLLPLALRILGRQRNPAVRDALAKLRAWRRGGAHRIDRNRDGVYEDSEAIKLMDAWWPRWITAEFRPALGKRLFNAVKQVLELDNTPNNQGDHLGSAYQDGWYGYASKDLRRVLGRHERGAYSRIYCGSGRRTSHSRRRLLGRCRAVLKRTLLEAIRANPSDLYADMACDSGEGQGTNAQWCFDSIRFRPLGAITQPLIEWQNRPTFQQTVEVQGHR